jgi:pilus assembly protein CpaF
MSSPRAAAGPLEPLLAVDGVTDVLVNGPNQVWLDRGRGLERAPVVFADDAAVRSLATRLATAAGCRLDDAAPFVDAALPDGTRLHAVLPPLTAHVCISLRVLARRRFDLDALCAAGLFSPPLREVFAALVTARLPMLISGGTATGKTTLLAALLSAVDPGERLVLVEDVAELAVEHPHVVRLTARTPNIEGAGAVPVRELARQALRMRPDRLVVGEFRGAEVVELLAALNSGHQGGAATVHANRAADVARRCVALGALAGVVPRVVVDLLLGAAPVVVQLRRVGVSRVVDEIAMLRDDGSAGVAVESVWQRHGGVRGAGAAALASSLVAAGAAAPNWLG